MSTQESRKKLVKESCLGIEKCFYDIGDRIAETRSESEADELMRIIRYELDNHIATEIWDYRVDWNQVAWKNEL